MEWVKTTAKTVPEAIDLALDNLGVAEDEAEIVVIEEPSKGLFGRVRGSARVEARIKPRAIRPKVDRGRNRRDAKAASRGKGAKRSRSRSGGSKGSDRRPQDTSKQETGTDRSEQSGPSNGSDRGGGSDRRSSRTRSTPDREAESPKVGADADSAVDERSGGGRKRRRPRSKDSASDTDRAASGHQHQDAHDTAARSNRSQKTRQSSKKAGSDRPPQQETPVQEVADHLKSFLGGLTEAFGLDGHVDVDESEPDILVATVDAQHGLMVGPKGRTLDAIQELARVSAQRTTPSSVRIKVDVGGYRKQRAAALEEFARKAADKAVDNGVEVALDPMSPADRKVIHDALNTDERVETRSVGNEPRRKVVVVPLSSGGRSDEEE